MTLAQHLLSRFHAIPRKQLEMGGKAMWAQMLDGAKNLNKLADSTTFYDYTQVATLLLAAVQFFQILQDHSA